MGIYSCASPEKEILFLSHRIPYPPDKGDKIRSLQLVRYLSRRHNLRIVAAADNVDDLHHARALKDHAEAVEVIPFGRTGALARTALGLVTGKSLSVAYFPGRRLGSAVRRLAAEKRPDVVVAFSSQVAPVAFRVGVPVVLDLVDRDSVKWAKYGDWFRGMKRILYRLEARRLARAETQWVKRSFATLVVSRHEKSLFSGSLQDHIVVVGNAMEVGDFPGDRTGEDDRTLLFAGALDYFPNMDAVEFFARDVMPRVRERVPGAEFLVVGPRAPGRLRALDGRGGVRLAGYVEDIKAVYSRAAVSVAPFRVTQGVLNKVLEAMASSIAVVATPEAVQGIDLEAGDGVALGRTPEELADQAVDLLLHREKRQRLGRVGRGIIAEQYAWPGELAKLDSILDGAMVSGTTKSAVGQRCARP